MHDPMTVAFEIPNPFSWRRDYKGRWRMNTLATIWHVDPEKDGTDDSCGWFPRARHGCPLVRKRIRSAFEFNWDADYGGWFAEDGKPLLSPMGIVLGMFNHAAYEHFRHNRSKADRFLKRHLADILFFAENTTDSLWGGIVGKYGIEPREGRISQFTDAIYGCVLRWTRPRWRHPRWHIHHWQVQVVPLQQFKRWAFSRCSKCGKRFSWGYAPVSHSWHGTGPLWFRSEQDVLHHDCGPPKAGAACGGNTN